MEKMPSSSKFTLFRPNGCITKISTSTPVTLLRSPCRSKVAADKMLAQCMDWLKSSLALHFGGLGVSLGPMIHGARSPEPKNKAGTSAIAYLRGQTRDSATLSKLPSGKKLSESHKNCQFVIRLAVYDSRDISIEMQYIFMSIKIEPPSNRSMIDWRSWSR